MTRMKRYSSYAALFIAIEIALMYFVDRPVSDYVSDLDSSNQDIIDIFRIYTDLGKSAWYLWPSAFWLLVYALTLRFRPLAADARLRIVHKAHNMLFFFSSIALSGIVTDIIKPILGRARPVEIMRDQIFGFHPFTFHASMNSMPSGHTTTAAALATALIILSPRHKFLWVVVAIVLAISRIMVNAHFVSDVLAGSMVGVLTTIAVARLRNQQGMFPRINGIFPIDKKPPVS